MNVPRIPVSDCSVKRTRMGSRELSFATIAFEQEQLHTPADEHEIINHELFTHLHLENLHVSPLAIILPFPVYVLRKPCFKRSKLCG